MAVREGFEPSMRLQTTYSLSRGAPSASRPPHHLAEAHITIYQKYVKHFLGKNRKRLSKRRLFNQSDANSLFLLKMHIVNSIKKANIRQPLCLTSNFLK